MSLSELLETVVGERILEEGKEDQVAEVISKISQDAHLKLLDVWARFNYSGGPEILHPLTPVPHLLWRDHHIDYLSIMHDMRGRMTGTTIDTRYSDFYFNKEQVSQRWPISMKRDIDIKFCGWELKRPRQTNGTRKILKP